MKILKILGTLSSINGGPVEAHNQQTSALLDLGYEVETVTLDGRNDLLNNKFVYKVYAFGPSLGKYRLNLRLVPWLIKHHNEFDIIIIDGIWQFQSFGVFLSSLFSNFQYYVFIHGALDPWFKKEYPLKHIKKVIYWYLFEYYVLHNAKAVLYTTSEEKLLAHQSFKKFSAHEIVVRYGIRKPSLSIENCMGSFFSTHPDLCSKRLFLYLGRLHPKKGVDILIESFSEFVKSDQSIHLLIVGPAEKKYLNSLKKVAEKHGLSEKITWIGMLTGIEKWGALSSAELFILPSHSENFGVAVVEALACGLPVLITNKVNIWREIQQYKAGLVCDDTVDGVVKSLHEWNLLAPETKILYKKNAESCFSENFDLDKNIRNLIDAISN